MHPEIHSDHPTSCSKCGMKLEQVEDTKTATTARTGKKQPIREQ